MSDPVRCPACGAANAPADAYCGACGASLRPATVPPVVCWSCGTPNPVGRLYCRSCGQPLAGPVAGSAPATGGGGGLARNPVLLALAIVLMVFLGIAAGFLALILVDDRGGTAIGEPSAAPTDPLAETAPPREPPTPGAATPRPERTPRPTPTLGPPGEFACIPDSQRIVGPSGTKWALYQVDFRTSRTYDRVIYQLRRTDRSDDGIDPFVSVRHSVPGEGEYVGEPPWLGGEQRLHVVLANGVRDRTSLDGYEPRGMQIVERLSTQRYRSHVNYGDPADDPAMADAGTLSTIDVLGQGCFALRIVGWGGAGDDTASVYVDISR